MAAGHQQKGRCGETFADSGKKREANEKDFDRE